MTAPWAPRASAALMSSDTMSVGWFASGLTFVDGREQLPSFGDAWEISVSVCLLSQSNGLVRRRDDAVGRAVRAPRVPRIDCCGV